VAAAAKRARAVPTGRQVTARNFYHGAVDQAERLDLERAQEIEGLDDEIALMRVRLKRVQVWPPCPYLARGPVSHIR
jgi:hypothetical protein